MLAPQSPVMTAAASGHALGRSRPQSSLRDSDAGTATRTQALQGPWWTGGCGTGPSPEIGEKRQGEEEEWGKKMAEG